MHPRHPRLALLLAAALLTARASTLRTFILIRTHKPTAAMKQRACHLAFEAAATKAPEFTGWGVLSFPPSSTPTPPPFFPCPIAVFHITHDNVTSAARSELMSRRRSWNHLVPSMTGAAGHSHTTEESASSLPPV